MELDGFHAGGVGSRVAIIIKAIASSCDASAVGFVFVVSKITADTSIGDFLVSRDFMWENEVNGVSAFCFVTSVGKALG